MRRTMSAITFFVTAAAMIAGCSNDHAADNTTVHGTFVLSDGFDYTDSQGLIPPSQLAQNPDWSELGCIGVGSFADAKPGTTVSMLDATGKIVATGQVATVALQGQTGCGLKFVIQNAPSAIDGAQVRLGQHAPVALGSDYETQPPSIDLVQ